VVSETGTVGERDIRLIVDIRNDVCPDGGLAVPGGDKIVPLVNQD
jgi:hypothetical protein